MNKKQRQMLDAYEGALRKGAKTELREVYGSYSYEKEKGLEYCKQLQAELDGYDGTIVGAATYFFSYAFKYVDEDLNVCLCYCTHANNHKFVIENKEGERV